MLFFQLGKMGRPLYGKDWAAEALRQMRDIYSMRIRQTRSTRKGNITRDCMIKHLASSRLERQFMFGLISTRSPK